MKLITKIIVIKIPNNFFNLFNKLGPPFTIYCLRNSLFVRFLINYRMA